MSKFETIEAKQEETRKMETNRGGRGFFFSSNSRQTNVARILHSRATVSVAALQEGKQDACPTMPYEKEEFSECHPASELRLSAVVRRGERRWMPQ